MIQKTKMKKGCGATAVVKFVSAILCGGLMCFFHPAICANAAQSDEITQENQNSTEISELSQIMVANEVATMKSEPDNSSETLMTYDKDALVFVIGETTNGWYFVTYQEKEGYVQKDLLRLQEIDVEELDAEMAANAEEAKFVVEAVEKYRSEARRSKIWGSIIIVLVISIFAIGIISTVKPPNGKGSGDVRKRKKQIKIEDWN